MLLAENFGKIPERKRKLWRVGREVLLINSDRLKKLLLGILVIALLIALQAQVTENFPDFWMTFTEQFLAMLEDFFSDGLRLL